MQPSDEIAALRRVLMQYGRHSVRCSTHLSRHAPCDCGWDKARDVLDRETTDAAE